MPTMTPNMNLILPTPGVDPGPAYAQENNTSFTLIDGHDHTPGKGLPITSASISITTDLSFLSHNATNLRATRFSPQASPISAIAPDINELYVSGVDLYYNDGNGNQVRVTQAGSIVGSPGNITGLPSGTAGVAYSSISQKFIFSSATSVPASLDAASAILRNISTPTNSITLAVPSSLAASFTITLPAAPPASDSLVIMSNTGALSTTLSPPTLVSVGTGSLSVTGNSLTLGTATIGTVNVTGTLGFNSGAATINQTSGLLGTSPIQIGGPGFAYLKPTSAANLLLNNVTTGIDAAIATTPGNAANIGLYLVRGLVSSAGTLTTGEGVSSSRTGTGRYTLNFSIPFQDIPAITISAIQTSGSGIVASMDSITTSSATIDTFFVVTSGAVDTAFSFIAMGKRP